ncbi:MAG TPA: STM3941 family protein [Planctomycetota bacterium]|jgi:hypothetical protein|nr:STM3941 family protein [Planctomycetota bacterium]
MIVVRTSRRRLFLLLLGSLTFVGVGLHLATRTPFLLPLGIVAVLFFGVCGGVILKRLLGHRIALIVDRNGVVDNSTATPAGRIDWDEISRIGIVHGARDARFIGIDVHDREALYARAKQPGMLRANAKTFEYPVQIAEVTLDRTAEEMVKLLDECRLNKKARAQLGEMESDLR